jgi:processing peptidase subunit beta
LRASCGILLEFSLFCCSRSAYRRFLYHIFVFSLHFPQEAHVALAFQGASWTSEYSYPLMVMQTILGSWDRSSAVGRNVSSR